MGKDEVALHWTAVAAHQKVGTYWHMPARNRPSPQSHLEAVNPHTGIRRIDEAFSTRVARHYARAKEMFIRFKKWINVAGGWIGQLQLLVGSPPVGLVFSEYAIANPAAWSSGPILLENGGWALFIYTSRGNNHGKALIDTAKTSKVGLVKSVQLA